MPAGITATDSMFATREAPWHRLGTVVDADAVTSAEAIQLAQMDWTVSLEPLYTQGLLVPDHRAVMRNDIMKPIGVVGNYYEPIQNQQMFDLFDEVIGLGDAIYETAGTLWGGRRVWILARLPENAGPAADPIAKYILMSSSHDGSAVLSMQWTPVRVVCYNTLTAALSGNDKRFTARHTSKSLQSQSAREILNLGNAYFDRFEEQVDRMLDATMTVEDVEKFLKGLYVFDEDKPYEKQHYSPRQQYEGTLDVLYSSPTIKDIKGTRYGVYNAVTEYLDHFKTYRSTATSAGDIKMEKSLASTWGFEHGASSAFAIRQQAWETLTEGIQGKTLIQGFAK